MNKKFMLLFGLIFWSNLQVASDVSAQEPDSDEEFYDTQEGLEEGAEEQVEEKELTPLEKLMADYPQEDEFTGVSKILDKERAKIIQELMYCCMYILVHGVEHSKYRYWLRKYDKIQKQREQAQEKLKEKKEVRTRSPRSPHGSTASSERDRTVDSDSTSGKERDFKDYESRASREKKEMKKSKEEKSSHGMSSPSQYGINRSDRSFDW